MDSATTIGDIRTSMDPGQFEAIKEKFDFTDGFLDPWEIRALIHEVETLRGEQVRVELGVENPDYEILEFPNALMKIQTSRPKYTLKLKYKDMLLSFRVLSHEGVSYTYERTNG
jgi:hypothetical protein